VADDAVTLTLDGRDVRITSPDKVFFSRRGETKLDLVDYYVAVAEPLLRTMGDRPVLLQRFPDGASGKSFFQKRVPKGTPDWLHTTVVSTPNGTTSNALVAADIAHVAWAVNLGCLGFHVWPYHWDDPNHTDELRIDLDPQPGVVFDQIREAAYAVKALCDELGVTLHVKTSGSKGMHLYIRLALRWNSFDVRAAAVAMARELERRHPALVTAAWWKEERGARVFVDFNQNAPHKTVFGAWSVRPRVGGQISMPISWDDVATVQPEELTIATGPAILDEKGDPWATINDQPQSLEPLLTLVAADVQRGLMDAPWPPVYPKQPNEPPRVAPSRAKKE
jgi:DNA ligase D